MAQKCLEAVILGWLVGFAGELDDTLRKCAKWFAHANSDGERMGDTPHFHSALRNEAYGLCLWMLGSSDAMPYKLAVEHWTRHFEGEGTRKKRGDPKFNFETQRFEDPFIRGLPFERKDILHGSLNDCLASCVQAGEFSKGKSLYESVGGKSDLADSRIQTDVHFGYWLCSKADLGEIQRDACDKIGRRVLQSNLQSNWLGMGQMLRAATWLKVVSENARWELPPPMVFSRAYDLMPKVARPAFVG
jgi:hypothetical protein